jgi:restriction system protein
LPTCAPRAKPRASACSSAPTSTCRWRSTTAWRDFAQAVDEAFTRDGYAVRRIEGAADFAVTRAGRTDLVAARRWKAARHGEEALAALHAQMRALDASGCTYIALGELSDNAQRFARAKGVQVMQEEGRVQLLRAMPVAK